MHTQLPLLLFSVFKQSTIFSATTYSYCYIKLPSILQPFPMHIVYLKHPPTLIALPNTHSNNAAPQIHNKTILHPILHSMMGTWTCYDYSRRLEQKNLRFHVFQTNFLLPIESSTPLSTFAQTSIEPTNYALRKLHRNSTSCAHKKHPFWTLYFIQFRFWHAHIVSVDKPSSCLTYFDVSFLFLFFWSSNVNRTINFTGQRP